MKIEAYKYLEEKYLDNFLNGEIYLNTFSNIRKLESQKMKYFIGDQHEGLALNKAGFLHIHPSSPNNKILRENLKKAGGSNVGDGVELLVINGTYINEINDAWMFCTSIERDDIQWLEKTNYNKCVKILDVFEFFERCAIEFEKEFKMRSSYGDCEYKDLWGKVDNGEINELNYYRKSKAFEHQKERRFVFEPFMEDTSYSLQPKSIKIKITDIVELVI